MKCNVTERQVYLLCDGLLDKEQRLAVETHVAVCGRCGRAYREARATLALLKRPAPADSCFDSAAAMAAIDRGLALGSRPPRMLEFPSKRPPLRFLAAAAVLVFAAVASVYYVFGLQNRNHSLPAAAAPASQDGAISTSARDSIVVFDRMCALKVCPNSSVVISRPERRVVHFDLGHGAVLIAAHKRLYDTIAVRCGTVTAVATGTHFSVDRTGDEVRVSVIEGTVTVRSSRTGGQTAVSCGELCLADGAGGSLSTGPLPRLLHMQLAEDFEALGPWAFPLAPPRGTDAHQSSRSSADDLASAQQAYAAVRHLIRRGDYDGTIVAIVNYLSRHSLDQDVAYCDLALCYSKTGRWESALEAYRKAVAATNDSLVREAVLHRSNSILFSKLGRYGEAEQGIRSYLASYPVGAWREREYGMLVKIELAQKRRDDAAQTVKAYQSEFPVACSVEEMQAQVAQLPRDSANKAGRLPAR